MQYRGFLIERKPIPAPVRNMDIAYSEIDADPPIEYRAKSAQEAKEDIDDILADRNSQG